MVAEAGRTMGEKRKSVAMPHVAKGKLIDSLLSGRRGSGKKVERAYNPMDLITLVREGLGGDTIRSIAEGFDIQLHEGYRLLHITPRTAQRMIKSVHLDVETSDRIVQLMKIHDRCVEVFEDREKMIRWLKTPNFALGDQTPVSLLDTTDGIELVANALTRIEYGVFA